MPVVAVVDRVVPLVVLAVPVAVVREERPQDRPLLLARQTLVAVAVAAVHMLLPRRLLALVVLASS